MFYACAFGFFLKFVAKINNFFNIFIVSIHFFSFITYIYIYIIRYII